MDGLLPLLYLLASVTFVLGIKLLGSPKLARLGNLIAAAGMTVAITGTMFLYKHNGKTLHNLEWIIAALIIGGVAGWIMAVRVKMTSMPQMVSFFNGMGGGCAALISILEYTSATQSATPISIGHSLAMMAGLIIGAVSFSGSIIAYLKLEDRLSDIRFGGQQFVNNGLLFLTIVLGALLVVGSVSGLPMLYVLALLALIFGVLFVFPIGGADMPVVISLLNSFTGVAAACGGFLYDNMVMLIGGILVGSAGTILTVVMCNSMNRSLLNVLIGNFGSSAGGGGTTGGGSYREVTAADAAVMMAYANRVVIVPGYGLAVAQAQHVCHQLEHELEDKGVTVLYAIHPVAGRMPGHMNVLLAEADVAYEKLIEMEEINADFPTTDVVLVVGANDVVNPAAKTDPTSPIYGMPILDAELARQVIIMKRSMKAGYAGIDNELFYRPNAAMLFGDAKASLSSLVNEVKSL